MTMTPGPWKVGRKGYGYVDIRLPKPSSAYPHGPLIAVAYQAAGDITKENSEANATAIAACPALVEAAEAVVDALIHQGEPCPICGGHVAAPKGWVCQLLDLEAVLRQVRGEG